MEATAMWPRSPDRIVGGKALPRSRASQRAAEARPFAGIDPEPYPVAPSLDAAASGPPTLLHANGLDGVGRSAPNDLNRRFEAIVFDWDGTAVPDRAADATALRATAEALSRAGVDLVIVSGTNLDNVDGQLRARPAGPGELHLCLNRGSEVFAVDEAGTHLVHRRHASAEEDRLISAAAELTVERLAAHGLPTEIVAERLNRRKIDLIPLPAWVDPPKACIAELVAAVESRLQAAGIATLGDVIEIARTAARDLGLLDVKVTSDAKHVEIGLTDKSDSASWAFGHLWERGIGPGLVLIVGDEFGPLGGLPGSDSLMLIPESMRATAVSVGVEPGGVPAAVTRLAGGPASFHRILEDQLQRRARHAVPDLDPDPDWTLSVAGFDAETERAQESLLSLATGRLSTAGAPLDDHPALSARVMAAGAYTADGPDTSLLPGPLCDRSGLPLLAGARLRRTLDLRTGVLAEETSHQRASRTVVRFASLARPGTVVLRAEGHQRLMPVGPALVAPAGAVATGSLDVDGRITMSVESNDVRIAAASSEARSTHRSRGRLDRLATYRTEPLASPTMVHAVRDLVEAEATGFDRLLVEQRAAWASRWADADIRIEGDDELERAIRFGLFHLMGSVGDSGEAAVGARGMSGSAYRGHVFWDSDVFVLPFLAATHPSSARAMLEYRVRRLPAAREAAAALGLRGARFPWESAHTGSDVTPRSSVEHDGQHVEIRTGDLEEHIVADVAWAAEAYQAWTADGEFGDGPRRALVLETARYWDSRIAIGGDGRAHIHGVIGPDEYHDPVDDNAFTNVMARWNLRRAARLPGATDDERRRWRELARRLVDGYDPRTRLYEQFAGFWDLEPLVISEMVDRRPVAADLLLGRDRVGAAQILKQPDVLMLHHMLPGATASGSLRPNLDFYEPRTALGSSLSPGIHAALFARAGQMEEAVAMLRLTARLDLDDRTGTTAGGLHLAAMGSAWQALVQGFAGIRPTRDALLVDPRLPASWTGLEIPVTYHGSRVRFRFEPESVSVDADRMLRIRFPGDRAVRLACGRVRFQPGLAGWQEVPS
jgi:trehalose/maltose hydrolase-like predicted phosphorylase